MLGFGHKLVIIFLLNNVFFKKMRKQQGHLCNNKFSLELLNGPNKLDFLFQVGLPNVCSEIG